MRKCNGYYTIYDDKLGKYVRIMFEDGLFHQWGVSYVEYESGPANYTVGIVELKDGKVVMPTPDGIQFIT